MCTVVVQRSAGRPVRVLALRDELIGRPFDDPSRWWPDQPDVVGGRDAVAGGTWCATRVGTGVTALVLNRPQQRAAATPGAPSRGVLPLLGVAHGPDWPAHVETAGMAGFLLVLATPDRLVSWDVDGSTLLEEEHGPGTVVFTSGGPEDRKAERFLDRFAAGDRDDWRQLVQSAPPADDPSALVVRHERDGQVFGTVFGQLIEAEPGRLRLEHSRRPWTDQPWTVLSLGRHD